MTVTARAIQDGGQSSGGSSLRSNRAVGVDRRIRVLRTNELCRGEQQDEDDGKLSQSFAHGSSRHRSAAGRRAVTVPRAGVAGDLAAALDGSLAAAARRDQWDSWRLGRQRRRAPSVVSKGRCSRGSLATKTHDATMTDRIYLDDPAIPFALMSAARDSSTSGRISGSGWVNV